MVDEDFCILVLAGSIEAQCCFERVGLLASMAF